MKLKLNTTNAIETVSTKIMMTAIDNDDYTKTVEMSETEFNDWLEREAGQEFEEGVDYEIV